MNASEREQRRRRPALSIHQAASAAETEALGAKLAERLEPGDVVLVGGEVGAGKTTLIRGACRALGVQGPVTSPTFTIGHRYRGDRVAVSHLDLYRLEGLEGEDPGLLDDYLDPRSIAFVEWPALAAPRLSGHRVVTVHLAHAGGDVRSIEAPFATACK
jgi:tRNA threonylcarbamoyladenosine biosynthesis protein TsaE